MSVVRSLCNSRHGTDDCKPTDLMELMQVCEIVRNESSPIDIMSVGRTSKRGRVCMMRARVCFRSVVQQVES